jgi:hypothetical protein
MILRSAFRFSEQIMPKTKMSIDFQTALAKPGRR